MSGCTCNPDQCFAWKEGEIELSCRCVCHARYQGAVMYRPATVSTVQVTYARGKRSIALPMIPAAIVHEIVEATLAAQMDLAVAIQKAAAHKFGEETALVYMFRAMQTLAMTNPSPHSRFARDRVYDHLHQRGISV